MKLENVRAGKHSGRTRTYTVCPATEERITYAKHFITQLLGLSVSDGVIVRRAVETYVEYLGRFLTDEHAAAFLSGEAHRLKASGAGDSARLSEEDLKSVPVKPYAELRTEHFKRTMRQRIAQSLKIAPAEATCGDSVDGDDYE